MFPNRYFAGRFFPARYWCKAPAAVVSGVGDVSLAVRGFAASLSVRAFGASLAVELLGDATLTVEN